MDNVKAFLDNIEFSVGRKGIPAEMEKYYTGAIEPRADEMAKIARGEPVPELDERIKRSDEIRRGQV